MFDSAQTHVNPDNTVFGFLPVEEVIDRMSRVYGLTAGLRNEGRSWKKKAYQSHALKGKSLENTSAMNGFCQIGCGTLIGMSLKMANG